MSDSRIRKTARGTSIVIDLFSGPKIVRVIRQFEHLAVTPFIDPWTGLVVPRRFTITHIPTGWRADKGDEPLSLESATWLARRLATLRDWSSVKVGQKLSEKFKVSARGLCMEARRRDVSPKRGAK